MKVMTRLLAATAVAGMATSVSAADMTMKFGHVEMQTFGSSQLGNDKEMLQKLKLAQMDFSLPSSIMSSVDDSFGIFEMPYIITSRDHMRRVQEEMMDVFQKAANDNEREK